MADMRRDDELIDLIRRAAPFVNAVFVIARDEEGGDGAAALMWLHDAGRLVGALGSPRPTQVPKL